MHQGPARSARGLQANRANDKMPSQSRYPVLGPDGCEAPGHCTSEGGTEVEGKLRLMP